MADDLDKAGPADGDRINVGEDYELRSWADRLGVTQDEIRVAVREVGPMAADVRKHLGK